MARIKRKGLTFPDVCDKICELEGFIDHLKEQMKKPFADKSKLTKQLNEAEKDLGKYNLMIMEVPDAKSKKKRKSS